MHLWGAGLFQIPPFRSVDSLGVCHSFSLIELCESQELNLGESTLTYIGVFFITVNHINLESAGKREPQLKAYLNMIVMWACL